MTNLENKTPEIGDTWEEIDNRFTQTRLVTILQVVNQRVQIQYVRKTWANIQRFNGKNGGYRFVSKSSH